VKKIRLLFLIVMFTLPLAAQDTAPDQTAPDQTTAAAEPQPKTGWKDRLANLKASAASLTESLPIAASSPAQGGSLQGDCTATVLFGIGDCQISLNGGRELLAWSRNSDGIQEASYILNSGQGRGGSVDYLGQVKGQDTYYMRSADGNDTYKVEGTLKNARVTEIKGDAPTGLIGGSEEAYASQDDNSSGNLDDVLKPIGTPVAGYKASAFLPGKGWQQVTIDQVEKGQITRFHDADNHSYKVVGAKFVADGSH